jgi:putative MATE family efflux protein
MPRSSGRGTLLNCHFNKYEEGFTMEFMDIDALRARKTSTIMRFSVPAIIGMVLTSCITITDGFFIGNFIDKDALAAVNLGLPIIYLFLATGLMLSVGGSVIAGMALGAQDIKKCRDAFNQTMAVTSIIVCILSFVVFFLLTPMLTLLHARGAVSAYFRDYYGIMLFELPVMIIASSFGMFIRAEGNPRFYMYVSVLMVVMNGVLDYLFAGPCHFGIKGIAYASLLSAIASLACVAFYFLKKSRVFAIARFTFDPAMFRDTMLNGSSEFIGELSMCVSMGAYNFVIMRRFGVDGVTAFTVVGYTAYLFSMIVVGFGQGASPLISFAYGAGDKRLAQSIRRRTNALVTAAGAIVVVLIVIASPFYGRAFVNDEAVLGMVRTGILIFMTNFLLCGVNAISSFYFTSIGHAKESAVISSSRGLVVLLIAIFVLPVFFGMNGVWMTSPVTEAVTLCLTARYLAKDSRSYA